MAGNARSVPLLRDIARRSYAAQAATAAAPVSPRRDVQVETTVLPSKLVVASVDNNSPVARVSVAFKGGCRYETVHNLGAAHMLRIAGGLTNRNSSYFGLTRNLQQIGASLGTSGDRETVVYTVEGTRDNVEVALQYLADAATKQVFKPWELSDSLPRLRYELATIPVEARTLDLLHKAAFRTGLGNTLFCPKPLVGKHSSETLQHYTRSLLTAGRTAVAAVGLPHGQLVAFAQNLGLDDGAGPASPTRYFGGEIRKEKLSDMAHVAVAAEGASLANQKEALAFAVLRYALGAGPATKWGSSVSPLYKAAAGASGSESFAVSALNVSYSDAGLFGFVASAPAEVAGKVVEAALKQLRAGQAADADVARGKAQLKAELLYALESGHGLLEDLVSQALLLGAVSGPAQLAAAVDAVSSADVAAAAKKVSQGKLSLAAFGQLHTVPYLDQL
ncbi:cytochrome b-c1 complex subunit 2, mitochondrial isoform X2 [Bacillus rossius redtenbacheri]|uniref:cytochrome b-c1 complex subunit 2, mitochondrial isoform X2 n=1 Tax=Bacillus rossius redtenbacheri TaxID=93214 RepID=UPI002FDE4674